MLTHTRCRWCADRSPLWPRRTCVRCARGSAIRAVHATAGWRSRGSGDAAAMYRASYSAGGMYPMAEYRRSVFHHSTHEAVASSTARAWPHVPRWAPPDGHPARTRSSPATSRRAHPAYACVRRIDKAPRKSPEKLASPTSAGMRHRWSGACTPARGARLTSGRGGGGSGPSHYLRVTNPTKVLVRRLPYAAAWAVALPKSVRTCRCPEKLRNKDAPSGS